jgi:hypothetical protein
VQLKTWLLVMIGIEHPNKVTRFEAAVALAELEDGRGWRFLLDAVRQAQDPESQEVAARHPERPGAYHGQFQRIG